MENFELNISNKILLRKLKEKSLFSLFVVPFATALLLVLLFDIYRIGLMPLLDQVILVLIVTLFFLILFCVRALIQWNGQIICDSTHLTYKCGVGFRFYDAEIPLEKIKKISYGQDYYDIKVGCYTLYIDYDRKNLLASQPYRQIIEYLNKDQAEKIQRIKPRNIAYE